jgi:hypothetical protein
VGIEVAPLVKASDAARLRYPARIVVPQSKTRIISSTLTSRIEAVSVERDQQVRRARR